MDEQNPLNAYLPLPTHPNNGVTSNRRGRPTVSNIIKFGPQPKSIVAQMLDKIKSNENHDLNKKILSDVNTHKNLAVVMNNDISSNGREESLPLKSPITNDIVINRGINQGTKIEIEIDQLKSSEIDQTLCEFIEEEDNIDQDSNLIDESKITFEVAKCENTYSSHSLMSNSSQEDNTLVTEHKHFICDYPNCDYSCNLSSNLIKHKRVHTNEKPYMCDKCSFRSNFVNSLKAHKRTHTAEKPYQCIHCSYKCNSSSNLKKHCLHRHPNCSNDSQSDNTDKT